MVEVSLPAIANHSGNERVRISTCHGFFPFQMGVEQKITDDMKVDNTNATKDGLSGAIYQYIPAETDGDAFMFDLQRGPGEPETIKFMVLHKFLKSKYLITFMLSVQWEQ